MHRNQSNSAIELAFHDSRTIEMTFDSLSHVERFFKIIQLINFSPLILHFK